jgi:hypothetical protein
MTEREIRKEAATFLVENFANPARDAARDAKRRHVADMLAFYDTWELARYVAHGHLPVEIVEAVR